MVNSDPEVIKSFIDIIDLLAPKPTEEIDVLPFCHTTNQGSASGILLKGMTTPKACDVYKEPLVYFFYGKACFLIEKELANYTDNPPVTFIYDQKLIKEHLTQILIKRILPFDSGGFPRYELKAGFDKEMYTYEETNFHKIIGFIRLLYKDHFNYLHDEVNLEDLEAYKDVCLQIQEIIEMYERAFKGKIESGEQVYSIELQYADSIRLKPSYLVIPYNLYTSAFWGKNVVKSFPDVKVVDYGREEMLKYPGKALTATQYQTLMRQKVLDIVSTYIQPNPSAQ